MLRWPPVFALLAVLALVALGCEPQDQGDSKPRSRTVNALLTVKASGEVAIDFQEQVPLTIVVIRSGVEDIRFLSVGIKSHVRPGPNERFRIAFDLVGKYVGAGDYEILASREPQGQSFDPKTLDLTNTYLLHARIKDDSQPISQENLVRAIDFNVPRKGCKIRVEKDEKLGSMKCPELASRDGKMIKVEMKWRLLPAQ